MNERRTVDLGQGLRLEFGPLWWKWWHRITRGGKWHWTLIGESCIVHDDRTEMERGK